MGLHQAQKLWHSKRNNKMKRQPTEWEKIFTNHISDKGLICKDLTQLNNQKQSDFKIGRIKWTFFQRGYQNGPWAHEKMFNITNHQGNANKNHSELSPHIC